MNRVPAVAVAALLVLAGAPARPQTSSSVKSLMECRDFL
jgi:hypothetical protein